MKGIEYFELANKYYNGDGVEENIKLALENYINAIKNNYCSGDVYYQLGLIFSENEEYYDLKKAIAYFSESYRKGEKESAIILFDLYSKISDIDSLYNSIKWIIKIEKIDRYKKDILSITNKILSRAKKLSKLDLENFDLKFKQLCFKCKSSIIKKTLFDCYNDLEELRKKDDYILSLDNVDYFINQAKKNNELDLVNKYLNRRFKVVTEVTKKIDDAIETYNHAIEYKNINLQERICAWIGDFYLDKRNFSEAEKWYSLNPILLKEKNNLIDRLKYKVLYENATKNIDNCQTEFLEYCINNSNKNFIDRDEFVTILNMFNREDRVNEYVRYAFTFFKNKHEREIVYNLLCSASQHIKLNEEELNELESYKSKIKDCLQNLVNKYHFNGFMRGEHLENLSKILNSGYFMCRNKATNFKDIANKEIIDKSQEYIKNYVRFYYSSTALTYYNFKSNNPHQIVFLIFDWKVATIKGTLVANGNAASSYTQIQNIIDYLYNDKLKIDWDTVFDSNIPFDENEFVYYETKRKRNTELLVPGQIELKKYLKKIVFESQKQMDMFYNNNEISNLDYYKSISIVDEGYFR